jgi:hypothetical protein
LAAAAALGLLVAALPRLLPGADSPWAGLTLLRTSALAFALGLAFLLDDPARRTTEAVPTGRAVRTWLRVALAAPATALCWAGALLLVPEAARPPLTGVTLEAAALAVTALALAAAAVRHGADTEPGRAAATGLPALVAVGLLLPDRWALFVTPGGPEWGAAHGRWAAVLAAALTAWAVSIPEPLRRRRLLPGTARS